MEKVCNMTRHSRTEYAIGGITIIWSLLSVIFKQPILIDGLSDIAPTAAWVFAGLVIGFAQITISSKPQQFIGTRLHFHIALASAAFWCYIGAAVNASDAGGFTVLIFWATAAATLWELAHAGVD